MSAHVIEFIERVEEKRSNARLAEHFISLSQRVNQSVSAHTFALVTDNNPS